jgi:hypothetical protein
MEILLPFALWLLSMPVAASMAKSRNRSPLGWFVAAFFFGPLALLFVALAGKRGSGWYCPYCKEDIQPGATICPHCRSALYQQRQ